MAILIHEIWEDEQDGMKGVCLAGQDGEGFRKLLSMEARCVHRFEAESHFEAMTIYYRLNGWGIYTSDFAADREPYPDDWAERQSAAKSNQDTPKFPLGHFGLNTDSTQQRKAQRANMERVKNENCKPTVNGRSSVNQPPACDIEITWRFGRSERI
jgi:hypothetical protein